MPGIVGIIGRGAMKEHAAALHEMIGSMLHESFYTSGRT